MEEIWGQITLKSILSREFCEKGNYHSIGSTSLNAHDVLIWKAFNQPIDQPTHLVTEVSRDVVVVVALVLARLEQVERLVGVLLLNVVAAAALGVVPPKAATAAVALRVGMVGVVGEDVAVDARRSRRVLRCRMRKMKWEITKPA